MMFYILRTSGPREEVWCSFIIACLACRTSTMTRAFVGVVAGSLQKMFRFGVGHDVRYPRDIDTVCKSGRFLPRERRARSPDMPQYVKM
jgi:hypothetical protein